MRDLFWDALRFTPVALGTFAWNIALAPLVAFAETAAAWHRLRAPRRCIRSVLERAP